MIIKFKYIHTHTPSGNQTYIYPLKHLHSAYTHTYACTQVHACTRPPPPPPPLPPPPPPLVLLTLEAHSPGQTRVNHLCSLSFCLHFPSFISALSLTFHTTHIPAHPTLSPFIPCTHLPTQLSHLSQHSHTCPPNSLTFHATNSPAYPTLSPFTPLTHLPTQLSHLSYSIHTPDNPPLSHFNIFILHNAHTCPQNILTFHTPLTHLPTHTPLTNLPTHLSYFILHNAPTCPPISLIFQTTQATENDNSPYSHNPSQTCLSPPQPLPPPTQSLQPTLQLGFPPNSPSTTKDWHSHHRSAQTDSALTLLGEAAAAAAAAPPAPVMPRPERSRDMRSLVVSLFLSEAPAAAPDLKPSSF